MVIIVEISVINKATSIANTPSFLSFPVIRNFPNQYHTSTNYIWLRDFKDNEFQDLLDKRNEIIHYSALESRYFEQYQDNYRDEAEIQKLQDEKEGIADYLINHNKLMFTGFEKAIKLIDEIP